MPRILSIIKKKARRSCRIKRKILKWDKGQIAWNVENKLNRKQ